MQNMDKLFPRYTDFSPSVPVWCVTPELNGCIHRFFDTSPISPSGRYLAVFQLPFEDRQPNPGEEGRVYIIDLKTGKHEFIADTRGWEPQMGANINWGGSDHDLFFNDVDTSNWQPFAWKFDVIRGTRARMAGTVYHASPDGKWLISANMTTMRKTQPGYGLVIPEEHIRKNTGPVQDDGFYLTETATGEKRLFASIKDLLTKADPPVQTGNTENFEIYGFHSKFNFQSSRLMLSLRWFPAGSVPPHKNLEYAWVTVNSDGSSLCCAVGPEQWRKRGHHATWFPDGEKISMNLNIDNADRKHLRFVQVNFNGSGLKKMHGAIFGSGHPTVYPGERYILTDRYQYESEDGTVPLRWIDLEKGTEENIVRINTAQPCPDKTLRIDPHPAWDRTWRYVAFNAFMGGTRRVFIADMENLLT